MLICISTSKTPQSENQESGIVVRFVSNTKHLVLQDAFLLLLEGAKKLCLFQGKENVELNVRDFRLR
ncbi:hypothetical protein LWI28_009279 [Acer negundo]|uniref:Uncharacterized protein n=1 Tax=Acer negundo TaxID=4023 RepID=A0AAD5P170_ACENE|nr:hypothetical protein LWI28_009279 [Acer negundo]KAK4855615.1 hypothetical protein QYF36_009081 [Acer negundo]